jgi:hypothetical protein
MWSCGEATGPRDVMQAPSGRVARAARAAHRGESNATRPTKATPPCLPCLRLLLRAAASLQSAAVDLELVAALAQDTALATDALILADAIDAELAAVDAVIKRQAGG